MPRPDGRSLSQPVLDRLAQIESAGAAWVRLLDRELVRDPWPSVGLVAAPDRPSTVFVMHPVYRELLHWYRRLQATWEATLDSPAFTLPLRSLPELYEIWCFTRVVAALQRGLGHSGYDQGLIRYRAGGFECALERGGDSRIVFEVGDRRVAVCYHKHYLGFTGLNYYPDITIEVTGPGGPEGLVVLEAKYRVSAEEERPSYKQEYRQDAHLPGCHPVAGRPGRVGLHPLPWRCPVLPGRGGDWGGADAARP